MTRNKNPLQLLRMSWKKKKKNLNSLFRIITNKLSKRLRGTLKQGKEYLGAFTDSSLITLEDSGPG
jgi:hypothetical protein